MLEQMVKSDWADLEHIHMHKFELDQLIKNARLILTFKGAEVIEHSLMQLEQAESQEY